MSLYTFTAERNGSVLPLTCRPKRARLQVAVHQYFGNKVEWKIMSNICCSYRSIIGFLLVVCLHTLGKCEYIA